MEIKSMTTKEIPLKPHLALPSVPHLSCRRRAGAVLSVTGQDLGTLGDESVTHSLHRAVQNTPVCYIGRRQQSLVSLGHMQLPTITPAQEC